jgi:hypothetical protein
MKFCDQNFIQTSHGSESRKNRQRHPHAARDEAASDSIVEEKIFGEE